MKALNTFIILILISPSDHWYISVMSVLTSAFPPQTVLSHLLLGLVIICRKLNKVYYVTEIEQAFCVRFMLLSLWVELFVLFAVVLGARFQIFLSLIFVLLLDFGFPKFTFLESVPHSPLGCNSSEPCGYDHSCEGRKEFCNPIIKFQYVTVPLFLGHDLHKRSLPSLFLQVIQESRDVWSGRNTALQLGAVCVKSFLLAGGGWV